MQIATAQQFRDWASNPTSDAVLLNDIDFGGTTIPAIGSYTQPFSKTLQGSGYKLSNLTIDGNGVTGLVPYLTGSVRNLKLGDLRVTSTSNVNNGTHAAGLIAGVVGATGVIENIDVSGNLALTVTGAASSNAAVAGLAGYLESGARIISVTGQANLLIQLNTLNVTWAETYHSLPTSVVSVSGLSQAFSITLNNNAILTIGIPNLNLQSGFTP